MICEQERRNVVILELKRLDSSSGSTSTTELQTLSVLQAYYDDKEQQVNISDVCTTKEFRGMGYATLLLKHMVALAELKGYKTITLDDCSDLFMQPNNIYLKLGFQYVNANQPEMIKYL